MERNRFLHWVTSDPNFKVTTFFDIEHSKTVRFMDIVSKERQ